MGRLMKYELKSMSKLFIPVWLGVLVLSVVNHLSIWNGDFENDLLSTLQGIAMFVYVVAIIGVAVFAFIYVILRFYQGLMKDEGYLTFTLPLRTDTILWAKAFSAVIISVVSAVVCIASIFIVVVRDIAWNEVSRIWQMISHELGSPGSLSLCLFLLFILAVAAMIANILMLYLSMGIGQLAQKHKVGASVLAYVGIYIVLTTVGSMGIVGVINHVDNSWIVPFFNNLKPMEAVWTFFGLGMAQCLVLSVLFYFPTRYIFSKKLNLE